MLKKTTLFMIKIYWRNGSLVILGLFGLEVKYVSAPKVVKILTKAQRSRKILGTGTGSGFPTNSSLPLNRGCPAIICGVDPSLKHKMFAEALSDFREIKGFLVEHRSLVLENPDPSLQVRSQTVAIP